MARMGRARYAPGQRHGIRGARLSRAQWMRGGRSNTHVRAHAPLGAVVALCS